ncbi:MAG TPA: hypothetical protein VN906_02400 [Candidatus Sulfotelmatobacter sp.]|nr:hypothetical protein [Candidatus Sulfotelmatobacter sp.]
MNVALAFGIVLIVVGAAWLLNVLGAGDYVMRRVTSRNLGTLAPGFAASKKGFRIYSILVIAIGVLCVGVGTVERLAPLAAGLLVIGAITFGVASVVAIAGEVATYRKL